MSMKNTEFIILNILRQPQAEMASPANTIKNLQKKIIPILPNMIRKVGNISPHIL